MAITGERPKAFSYVRFSTPDQAKGSSYERQSEAAQAFARERGLELAATTYNDLGVSAFRHKHAQTGALRAFLKAVEDGEIPSGSFLLVESLDRISRNSITEAQGLFNLIIGAGITLVTLLDKREYSRESINANPTDLIFSIVIMMRGHEESTTKSRRVADAYERKRKDAATGNRVKPFTRMLPAWLEWRDDTNTHAVRPKRADVLLSIFKKADAGWGQHRIAQWLNEDGVETWGGQGNQRKAQEWHRSYVKKLLTNSAVVGTFTPHQRQTDADGKRKRKPLEAIEGYFPAVVDRDLFERVASRARATAARGRNATTAPASIFAGVLKCVHCSGAVTRVSKGAQVYLVCSKANRKGVKNGCRYQAVSYKDVELAFRRNARSIIRDAPRGPETEELEGEIANLDNVVSVIADEARDLADELIQEKSAVVRARLRDKETELEAARERLRALRAQKVTLARPYVLRRLGALKDALRRKPFSIPEVNKALKEAVSKIILDPEAGRLAIYWHHASEPTDDVPFFSRHSLEFGDKGQ
jgi:DNA invertase Pin-like site-specific DNA recombinase